MTWVGLSLMPEPDFAAAAHSLLEAGEVDVLEWSFDVGWATPPPDWATALIDHVATGRIAGRGRIDGSRGHRIALLGLGERLAPLVETMDRVRQVCSTALANVNSGLAPSRCAPESSWLTSFGGLTVAGPICRACGYHSVIVPCGNWTDTFAVSSSSA